MRHSECDVVILVGGKGSRLQSVVSDVPKPMAKVEDRPFLDILIKQFADQGFRRFILCTGFMKDIIHQYYQNPAFSNLDILFSEEEEPLGTGGAIQHGMRLVKSNPFFALNGDCYCPINYKDMFDFHQKNKSWVTIASAHVDDASRFGTLEISKNHELLAFKEKQPFQVPADINTGVYLLQKEVYSHPAIASLTQKYSIEHAFFPQVIADKLPIYAFPSNSPHFVDIGTPESYLAVKDKGFH